MPEKSEHDVDEDNVKALVSMGFDEKLSYLAWNTFHDLGLAADWIATSSAAKKIE